MPFVVVLIKANQPSWMGEDLDVPTFMRKNVKMK